ncbi:hypothetical protein LCGC14_1009820 [marine sediment metagenome]|uniref:site-specific DNA-methyltransferase (cytosine-N(4)-specific) n=1 Tax=marine sediment metagenome TaxID=412755 RepID=A0A0F9NLY3_9ZZZZ
MTVEIVCADARDALAAMPEGSVQTCITSPPYWGLRDYGLEPVVWGGEGCEHEWGEDLAGDTRTDNFKSWANNARDGNPPPDAPHIARSQGTFCRRCSAWRGTLGLEPTPALYVEHIVQVFREVRRVLRDDGTLWLNLGDSYASSPPGNKATGWEKWKTSGLAGAKEGSQYLDTLDASVGRKANTIAPGLKPKDLCGMPWRVAFALQADGWWLRSDIVWSKPNPMPESVRDRPTRSHEYLFLLSKSARYYYDQDAIREPAKDPADDLRRIAAQHNGNKSVATAQVKGLRPRSHKGSHFGRGKTAEHQLGRASSMPRQDNPAGRNRRSVWEIATQPYPEAHFATFPEKLVEPCILAGCPEGGTVLDPFAGSGTVGLVAERLGRHSVLIDANEDYCKMARERTAQMGLMTEATLEDWEGWSQGDDGKFIGSVECSLP